jgi:hypothetical protein
MATLPVRAALRRHPGRRLASPLVAVVLTALFGTSCSAPVDPVQAREERLAAEVREGYGASLASIRPGFVLVTYPISIGALSAAKQLELRSVRRVLADLGLRHRFVERATVLETVTYGARQDHQALAYRVPDDVAVDCTDGKVLFLNLQTDPSLQTVRHPEAVLRRIDVLVWDDPMRVDAAALH